MTLLDLIFGFLLVFAGRNFFWLCVGVVGFLIGVQCAVLLGFPNEWTALVSALALGSVGVVLAISFEWITVIFGVGFLGGGYLLMNTFPSVAQQDPYSWLIFVVGGIVGICLMVITFDWALIVISSLLGATLIVNAFHLDGGTRQLWYIGCILTGMVVQRFSLKRITNHKHTRRRQDAH